ncbi:methionyl-tRNA formyltransferase [Alicyclobacillus sp. SO9]|uniref:methionyl-tRNA formyltransferase n=1 Tax=Alicyclobacillus sp. SO9 TaxID=2665646 RepID=UPI0018E7441E|nr:methionyl-tRNA formyltransferase [Alicyclobacillus sp. SO9]QQE80737.1 methionyl-tRNA formyltransferase [Alicyclobacillus sp. SO9]
MKQAPRVVFMGTPDFSVPILRSLAEHSYDIRAVITQPDKPVGRKRTLTPPPVKSEAQRLGLTVLQPKKVRDEASLDAIAKLDPDVIVTAAYGQILPQKLLEIPKAGCINVHASLLPRWRGAAPIHRALQNGDRKTGITLMEMVLELDAGPILSTRELSITAEDNVGTLHDKLAHLGAELLIATLPEYVAGHITPQPQPTDGITYANRILSDDEEVDFTNSSEAVHNHVRALSPWPGARTSWNGVRLKLWQTRQMSADSFTGTNHIGEGIVPESLTPGTVFASAQGSVLVQCRDKPVQLVQVQPAGKKAMAAEDWFRGIQTDRTMLGENG